ncbi:hypothetical protein [Streptomyces sp. 3211]|uniref:hypothetical protein n=1 Tax=Streptomyces sp. 3211 TaxID=1964449 RepID=UPI00133195EB|nr:hypothetical protein [Streptomyces sp. 3211]
MAPAALPNGAALAEGLARGVQIRSESRGEGISETVLTFRVERYDAAGDRTTLIPVEMRGLTYEGSIHEGDWVRVRGKAKSGTLRATRLENLTTGASVHAKGVSKAAYIAAISIFVLAVAALIIWAISDFGNTPGPPPGFPTGFPPDP